ncbi:MAG: SDR family NAD(P)-dependent oxidoreductase, partial [Proteobacteria bacterium]|nr:SDR family NAD(P)-dependent oxidoreductase [Pseudomonadota bacterium]
MDLTNKVVLITGAASGLGAATARWLAEFNMRVALLDFNLPQAETLAEELGGIAISADVTDSESIKIAVQKAVDHWGGIHVCVNCAGIATAARIVAKEGPTPLEEFQKVIQVNLVGTFNVMRHAAAQMIKQPSQTDDGERGVIINTASIAAEEGQVGQAAYSASKGGVAALTLPAAREFSQFGIRVMAIAPGIVDTPMIAKMPQSVRESLAAAMPFPKRLAKP